MIQGFDSETSPLSDYERQILLPIVLRGLSKKVGKGRAVSSAYIVERLRGVYRMSGPRLRKIVNHIRYNDLLPGLIATSDGYYVAQSEQELDDYEQSLLGREKAIRAVRLSIARQKARLYPKEEPTLFD